MKESIFEIKINWLAASYLNVIKACGWQKTDRNLGQKTRYSYKDKRSAGFRSFQGSLSNRKGEQLRSKHWSTGHNRKRDLSCTASRYGVSKRFKGRVCNGYGEWLPSGTALPTEEI